MLYSSSSKKWAARILAITLGYVGMIPSSYPINAVYQWSRGPEEAILWVALKHGSGVDIERLKEDLRQELPKAARSPRLVRAGRHRQRSDEFRLTDADRSISQRSEVLPTTWSFAEKLRRRLAEIPALRDLQFSQSLEYPTVDVKVDREKAGLSRCHSASGRSIAGHRHSVRRGSSCPTIGPIRKRALAIRCKWNYRSRSRTRWTIWRTMPIQDHGQRDLLLRDVAHVDAGHHARAVRSV